MQKKLTITIDEEIYAHLHQVIGRGHISGFIENLVRPHIIPDKLDAAYKDMAEDEERESEAEAWVEGVIGDLADEPR
jgi:predicted CopG family antitoxin